MGHLQNASEVTQNTLVLPTVTFGPDFSVIMILSNVYYLKGCMSPHEKYDETTRKPLFQCSLMIFPSVNENSPIVNDTKEMACIRVVLGK